MKALQSIRPAALALVWLALAPGAVAAIFFLSGFPDWVWLGLAPGAVAAGPNPFFAMDTALRDGQPRTAAQQAALLKDLGYQGFGASGYPTEETLAAFEKAGLQVFNAYLMLSLDAAKPELDPKLKALVPRLKGHNTALWLAIRSITNGGVNLKPSAPQGDEVVERVLRPLADLCQTNGVNISLYPHTGFWLERVEVGLRLARKLDRPNVGVTFNLCHWLKVEGGRDPRPVLKEALPRLSFVTINGADGGDTRNLPWDRLIQPLDAGSYDVAALMKSLRELGYRGPVGFQGYGIPGDSYDILRRTMKAWRLLNLSTQPQRGAPH